MDENIVKVKNQRANKKSTHANHRNSLKLKVVPEDETVIVDSPSKIGDGRLSSATTIESLSHEAFAKMQLQSPGAIPKQALLNIAGTPIRNGMMNNEKKKETKGRVVLAAKNVNGGW